MDSLEHQLHCRLDRAVDLENPEAFIRPVELSVGWRPAETARMAQPLGFNKIGFTPPKCPLGPFAILEVDVRSVPFDDYALLVTIRFGAREEPTIFAIEPPQPRFEFEGRPASNGGTPRVHVSGNILGVKHRSPSRALELLRGHLRVGQEALVMEIVGTVGQRGPDDGRDGINGGAQLLFRLPRPLFGTPPILDI